MFYEEKNAENIKEGKWDEKSCVRRIGGYDIDLTNIPSTMKFLPKGAVLAYNAENGKAVLVKTAEVNANAAKDATSVQVKKGHILVVGDTIAGATISAITEGDNYDTLTVSALPKAVTANAVVNSTFTTLLGLNYATVALKGTPSCTPTLQAYEIEEDSLPYVINDAIKEGLTVRHAFKI